MKHLIPHIALVSVIQLFGYSIISSAVAAMPQKWDVDLAEQPPQVFTLQRPRGETYELEAVLKNHGKPFAPAITNACIYWQTNGMANLYWSAPASVSNNVLRATWLPSMDPGATTVRGYIGDPGHIYAAAFQFRFIASPGATPNALPLPTPIIDFSRVTVLNPPWSDGGSGGVDTNAVIDIVRKTVDGAAKMLPRYLWCMDFDDSYPDDAVWYYAQPQDYGSCSAVRDGGLLCRNYDWKLDDAAEFVVRMSAGQGRFASIGVANCGTNLTEELVTSGQPSRYYKCLPGRTVDGINENGVVCEVNVVDGDQHDHWPTNGVIHCMGVVRWTLDHATDAGTAARYLVEHVFFPPGFAQNLHWMIADESSTYIVENGACSNITGRAVMTNFPLIDRVDGMGLERYNLLVGGESIINTWFTRAYSRSTSWESEFKDADEMEAAKSAWETYGREELRGNGLWQSVHTSVYDITNRTLRVAVQEVDDWYAFAVPSAGGVKPEAVKEIVDASVGGTNAVKAAVAAFPGLSESVRILDNYSVPSLESSVRRIDESVSSHESQLSQLSQNKRDKNDYSGLALGNSSGNAYRAECANYEDRPWTWPEIIGEFSKVKSVNGMTGDVEIAAADIGAASADDVSTLNLGFTRLYNFSAGATNANISVTNYPPTAAEAEGRTHFDPTDPDLDFSTVPASMRLDETRGGEKRTVVDTRDWTVWWWIQKAPKLLASANGYAEEKCAELFARLSAWADRTARGLENPAGESTLVIDVPNIWLMTDQTFEKHVSGSNSCWVIRSKNAAVSPNVATNGFLELTDAFGTPYVRFNKTEATFADPPASGIYHDDEAGEWIVTYETDARPKGGANLAIEGDETYPGKAILKAEDDELCPAVITWTGSSGHWLMHAKPKQISGADPEKMFFGAVVEIEGQDFIEYLKPVSFSHIVLPNGKKIAPDVPAGASPGTTVSWKVVE